MTSRTKYCSFADTLCDFVLLRPVWCFLCFFTCVGLVWFQGSRVYPFVWMWYVVVRRFLVVS